MANWFKGLFGREKHVNPARTIGTPAPEPRIPTIKFNSDLVTEDVTKEIGKTIRRLAEFKGLDELALTGLDAAAIDSVRKGGDLGALFRYVKQIEDLSLERRRAEEIVTFIHSRATALIGRNRQLSIGIMQAKWLYAGRPCCLDARHMTTAERRTDSAHKTAGGQIYAVELGMLIEGRYAWPGYNQGCRCVSIPIVPGLSG